MMLRLRHEHENRAFHALPYSFGRFSEETRQRAPRHSDRERRGFVWYPHQCFKPATGPFDSPRGKEQKGKTRTCAFQTRQRAPRHSDTGGYTCSCSLYQVSIPKGEGRNKFLTSKQ